MAGSAQLWPGPRMRAFFRSVFLAEAGVDARLADRLAEACVKRINRMLVWDASGSDGTANAPDLPAATSPAAAAVQAPATDTPLVPPGTQVPELKAKPTFDPFAFSVVVVLKRKGRNGLAEALKAISSTADLHKLADAQHLGVDPAIKDARKLREAIIKGAEQRIADRKAAAS